MEEPKAAVDVQAVTTPEANNTTATFAIPPDVEPSPQKGWVQFADDNKDRNGDEGKSEPAVISTESVQVNLDRSIGNTQTATPRASRQRNEAVPASVAIDLRPLRNVELPVATVEPIRQGFANGDVIVTLLPVNTRFPWLTPAQFRPELVPEELMAQGLTLTVEEYVQAMELLVNDVRFTLYNVCYKRVLVVWITVAFCVLLGLLFSGLTGLLLFALGIVWLVMNAGAIFLSMWVKFKLQRNLERCLAHVNKQLLRHKIVIALDDRGKISCHKVNLCFLYLNSGPCIAHLERNIEQMEQEPNGWEQRMDINSDDIIIQGTRTTRLSRKQGRAELMFTRYLQRWGKDLLRRRLDWTLHTNPSNPRHLGGALCPCQYVEEMLASKPPPMAPLCAGTMAGQLFGSCCAARRETTAGGTIGNNLGNNVVSA